MRCLSIEAERHLLMNPELTLGEAYMDGTLVVEQGTIADALVILLDQPEMLPRWAKLQWWLRYLARHAQQFNPRSVRRTMSRATTISTDGSIPCSSMPTSNTAAPISNRPT